VPVHIFANIDAAWRHCRQHFFQRYDHVLRPVRAIVNENVNPGHLVAYLTPKGPTRLIPHKDARLRIFELFASRLNVYSVDATARAKVLLPHAEAATTRYPDLEDIDLGADKAM
jgi:hypothetical protein